MQVYSLAQTMLVLSAALTADPTAEIRRLLEAGDFPRAEVELVKLLEGLPEGSREERALVLAKLAEARAFQGASQGAVEAVEEALGISRSTPVRQSAVLVYLRAQRHAELLAPAESLLVERPGDPGLRFARGLALAKTGKPREALDDLRAATEAPEWRRDARFELSLALAKLGLPAEALAPLREILEDDPYDAEACYQASRQLLRLKKPEASRLAAVVTRYFEALREAEGHSSRAEHLAFAGKPVESALERAGRWERLGAVERAVAEAERARAREGGEISAGAWLEGYYRRLGFSLDPSRGDLAAALAQALASGDGARAQRAAKLLLIKDSRSAPALRCLLDGTADPSLIVPRLHYLRRFCEVDTSNAGLQGELATLRAAFAGDSRPR